MRNNTKIFLFFSGIIIFLLWQMLLPGYVLTLDMVSGPEDSLGLSGGTANTLPLSWAAALFSFLPAWLVQKVFLTSLFFLLFLIPFFYLPVGRDESARLIAAFIYALNPFVYVRMLAGHWQLLFAYALLPWYIHSVRQFWQDPSGRKTVGLAVPIAAIGVFSLHYLVLAAIGAVLAVAAKLIVLAVAQDRKRFYSACKSAGAGAAALALLSSYWLVPIILGSQDYLSGFDCRHWEAFSPAVGGSTNIYASLLTLNGFWGEARQWGEYFIWPQDSAVFWTGSFLVFCLVIIGVYRSLSERTKRRSGVMLCLLGLFAFLFAAGAGDTVFKGINVWLYNHIFFWPGFRDSHKFLGWLSLVYAVFAGLGAAYLLSRFKARKYKDGVTVVFLVASIVSSYAMWGGWQGQLRSVWYPDAWHKTKAVLEGSDPTAKVLLLPWHGYFSLDFNRGLLTANPGKAFFGDGIIQSRSVEMDGIYGRTGTGAYQELDKLVTGGRASEPEETIRRLRSSGFEYIVYVKDISGADNLSYGFLGAANAAKIRADKDIELYRIAD